MGGIIIIIGTLIPVILMSNLENIYIQILIISTLILGTIGLIDDYIKVFKKDKKGLHGKFKIAGQSLLGIFVGIVLLTNNNITIVGWELCRGGANLTEDEMEFVYSFETKKGDFTIDCNKHALDSSQNWLGDPGLGLPDPVAMAVALNDDVVLKQDRHHVKIVVDGPARGMTIVDELNVGESEPHIDENWSHTTKNINVIWEIDNQEWKETLYKTLKN